MSDAAPLPYLRLVEILGDSMEPTLRRRDFALCRSVVRYEGEGLYLVEDDIGERFFRVDALGAPYRLMLDNPLYRFGSRDRTLAEFSETVRAKVVADLRVREHAVLQDLLAARQSPPDQPVLAIAS